MVYPQVEDNLLDLGLVRFDKKPFPIIEFRIENTGQSKYFIIPKLLYDEDLNRIGSYLLDVGDVKLNECKKSRVKFVFHGPGIINACVRADTAIPGLAIRVKNCFN